MARKTPIRHDPIVGVFAGRLRELRRSRGMTLRDLSRKAHVTESYLSRLEGGSIAPGIDLVARIARALGTTVADLLPSDDSNADLSLPVLTDQAKRLFETVLRGQDPAFFLMVNQILARLAESVERQG